MATTASSIWTRRVWEDLQPAPGRLNASLRITLASVLTLLILMTLRMPVASLGLYFVFLVGRDSPAVSIRTSLLTVGVLAAAVALELGVVIVTDNSPMARLVSVAAVSFLAGVLMLASNDSSLASIGGFIFCTLIAAWEIHAPADTLVNNSLSLVATVSIAMGCSTAVEYIFGARHPAEMLQQQLLARYRALEDMFTRYAEGAEPAALGAAALRTRALAVQGQSGMQRLYNQIVERNLDVGALPVGSRVRITMLAQLMDLSAAFASQNPGSDPSRREHYARIAARCQDLRLDRPADAGELLESLPGPEPGLLDRVESVLHTILSMPPHAAADRDQELIALPTRKAPFLTPGALGDKDTIAFALKISLCATVCYVIDQSIDWPGLSTSVTTVLIAGLSSSGAIKQRLAFRLLGSVIGGLLLGLGCAAFLFPHMDSIAALVLLVAVIAFLCGWCAAGRRFNYVGLQIAFSFYLVAFEGFSAPTALAPARDRFIGILLALIVMIFVFDQLWPVRTVTAMRHRLAAVLRSQAALFRLLETARDQAGMVHQADAFRDYTGKAIASLRTMNEAVEFEFGVDRDGHLRSGEMIVDAALTAAALFWNQLAFLHQRQDQEFLKDPGLAAMGRNLAGHLETMAKAMVQKVPFLLAPPRELATPALLSDLRYGEYARNAVARFEELQSAIAGLSVQA